MPYQLDLVWNDEGAGASRGVGERGEPPPPRTNSPSGNSSESRPSIAGADADSIAAMLVQPVERGAERSAVVETAAMDTHYAVLAALADHRTQAQKRDLVCIVAALVICAVLLNHVDRLHCRIRHLEMLLAPRHA